MPRALVTGGAGYIGSHTCLALLQSGWDVTVVDNLSNSSAIALERVRQLTAGGDLSFHRLDLRDGGSLAAAFRANPIDAVVHFAGLKAVGESVSAPLRYYDNNIVGTINLVREMQRHAVRDLVFSSSCTVYGNPGKSPVDESSPVGASNPYGRT
jgi:UDP-glucose 4-epimerase